MTIIPGQSLRGIPARQWNRFERASDIVLGSPGYDPTHRLDQLPFIPVLATNSSGAKVNQFGLLGFGGASNGPVHKPSTNLDAFKFEEMIFDCAKPDTDTDYGKWLVALEDIEDGDTGPAALAGMMRVELETSPTVGDYVTIKDGSYLAQQAVYGEADLLFAETDSGKRWGLILKMGYRTPPVRMTVPSGGLNANASAACTITDYSGTVTVWNDWMEAGHNFANGDEITTWFNRHASRAGDTDGYFQLLAGEC